MFFLQRVEARARHHYRYVALDYPRSSRFGRTHKSPSLAIVSVLEDLGGVGPEEEVRDPVEEHLDPVEVVAQLVEVHTSPDEGSEQAAEPHAQDVDQRAALPEVHELTQRTVAEGLRLSAFDLRGEVERGPLALLLGGLGQGGDGRAVVVHGDAVADGVHAGTVLRAQELVHHDPSAVVLLHLQVPDRGSGFGSCGPHRGAGWDGAAVREGDGVGTDLFGWRIVYDLHPLGGEPEGGGVGKRRVHLFEDRLVRIHEHEAYPVEVHVRIILFEGAEDEVERVLAGPGAEEGRATSQS